MNKLIDPATGLPLRFPNPRAEAYARAQEFRRLSPDERWKQIAGLMEIGMNIVHASPRRAEIERRMEAEETEWKQLQRKVFSQHGT
jgi:hypothetical protein